MMMSSEAAGFALADTLYRRQSLVLGDEHLLKAGERLVRHLNRRGYRLQYDPSVIEHEPEQPSEPVPVPRLEPKPVESRQMLAVTLSIGQDDLRCLACGCWSFYVKDNTASCSSCGASHTIRR
jgi:hypothetical protein